MPFPLTNPRDWRLATKLAILLVALAMLPLAAITLYNDIRIRDDLLVQARTENLQRARATALALDTYLSHILDDIRLAAADHDVRILLESPNDEMQRGAINLELRQQRSILNYDAIYVIDRTGTVLAASNNRIQGRNYVTARWFLNAIAGQASMDEPRFDSEDLQSYLHFSAPVLNDRGVILGVVTGRIALTSIDQIIHTDNDYSGRGDVGVLWNDLGVRLSHGTNPELRFYPLVPLSSDVASQLASEQRFGPQTQAYLDNATQYTAVFEKSRTLLYDNRSDPYVQYENADTEKVQAALTPLKTKRWVYGIFTSEDAILAPLEAQTQRGVEVALIVGVLAVAAAAIAARWATRPIRSVVEAANAIAAGDLSRRANQDGQDEVGQLAAAFDKMADSMAIHEAQLRRYAAEMEIRVRERTADLAKANASLQEEVLERQRAEQEVQQLNMDLEKRVVVRTAQLEAANRELEAFAYSVSHDLRAPLRGINGFSDALMEDYGERLDDQARHYLRRILLATQQMSRLIDDLLRLSRIMRAELNITQVDLSEIADSILAELRNSQPERRINVRVEPGLTASADANLVRIALDNLLRNAWKFTSRHESALIEFGRLGEVFFVRDDGAGFDMQNATKLFRAFQRLHGPAEFEGTGIGLAMVSRIIQRHGGQVWAEGEVEKGAIIYFTLK